MKNILLIFLISFPLLHAQVNDPIKNSPSDKEEKVTDKRINFMIIPSYEDRKYDFAFKLDYFWASFKAFFSLGKTKLIEVENGDPQPAIDEMVYILKQKKAKVGSVLNDHHGRLSSGIFTFIGVEFKRGDISIDDDATLFERKAKPLEALTPFMDEKTKILLGNCNAGQDVFQPLLVHLSGTLNTPTIYAHMSYCMSPSLFFGGGFENLTAQQLDYGSCTVGENVEAYEAIGTWKKIKGPMIDYVGMMRFDYWGNVYETHRYFYDDADRSDRLNTLINQLKSK